MKETVESIWQEQAITLLAEAQGFMKPLEQHLVRPSRFDNTLLFNLVVMSFEKLFVALLAHYEVEALHHTPLALFKEARGMDKGLTDEMRETVRLIASHESICSLDDKGYTTPSNDELIWIIKGLIEMKRYIEYKINT